MSQSLLDYPVWGVYLIIILIIFTAFEIGFLIGRYRYKHSQKEKDALVGPMVGSTLGLLAFMLSFSFGVASSHFDTRRHLVLDEANAIHATYDMAALLPEGARLESRKLLREYVDIRVSGIQTMIHLKAVLKRSNEIQKRLWETALTNVSDSKGSTPSVVYLQTLHEMFSLQTKRVSAGVHGNISTTIWVVLFGLAFFGMSAMGYHAGLVGKRGYFAYIVVICAFSLVMVLIYDLDRPRQGLFKVSQGSMIELQQRMAEEMPFAAGVK